eukprot:8702036-Pyramimonas_sp.AAC.1
MEGCLPKTTLHGATPPTWMKRAREESDMAAMPSRSGRSSAARKARRNSALRRSTKRARCRGERISTEAPLPPLSVTKYLEVIPPAPSATKVSVGPASWMRDLPTAVSNVESHLP